MCPKQILFAVRSRLAIDITQIWLVKFQGYVHQTYHLISHMITIPHSIHGLPQRYDFFQGLRPRSTCRGGSSREDDEVATATEGVGWVEGAWNDGYHCWGGMYRIITYINSYIYIYIYLLFMVPMSNNSRKRWKLVSRMTIDDRCLIFIDFNLFYVFVLCLGFAIHVHDTYVSWCLFTFLYTHVFCLYGLYVYTCIFADLHTLYYTKSVNWIGCARRGHTSRVFPRRFELQQHERALERLVSFI